MCLRSSLSAAFTRLAAAAAANADSSALIHNPHSQSRHPHYLSPLLCKNGSCRGITVVFSTYMQLPYSWQAAGLSFMRNGCFYSRSHWLHWGTCPRSCSIDRVLFHRHLGADRTIDGGITPLFPPHVS